MSKRNRLIYLGLIIPAIMNCAANAQSMKPATVTGSVVDHSTGKPLTLVNVFLANTTKGTTTNKIGVFWIKPIPIGSYELVVSMMGYEVQTRRINLSNADTIRMDFRLHPRIIPFDPIVVEEMEAEEWQKNLELFKEEFFGKTASALKCEILNPEVLDFEVRESPYRFTATAREPLEIINWELGYRVQAIIMLFSLETTLFRYAVKPKFEKLESDEEKQRKKWIENRRKAYNGSLRHFLASLVKQRLRNDGFAVWKSVESESKSYDRYLKKEDQRALLLPGLHDFERRLHFDNYLRVVYERERDDLHSKDTQMSFIKLTQEGVTINQSGQVYDNLAIVNYGRWAEERFAEELPLDYVPGKN